VAEFCNQIEVNQSKICLWYLVSYGGRGGEHVLIPMIDTKIKFPSTEKAANWVKKR